MKNLAFAAIFAGAALGMTLVPSALSPTAVRAEDKKEASPVELTEAAFKEMKDAQAESSKQLGAINKEYKEAKTEEDKAAIQKRYREVQAENNAKIEKLRNAFLAAFEKAGADVFDAEKQGDLLGLALYLIADKRSDTEDYKGAIEAYEMLLKRLPKSNYAGMVRAYSLPSAFIEAGDLTAAAKRVADLAKAAEEKEKPGLLVTLGDIYALNSDAENSQKAYADAKANIPDDLPKGDPRGNTKRYLEARTAMLGKPAPEIDFKTWIGGEARKLSDLKGNVVLIDLWATWCGPCRHAMIGLNEMHKKYSSKGFTVLGVTKTFTNGTMPAEAETTKDAMAKTTFIDKIAEKDYVAHLESFHKNAKIAYPFILADDTTIKAYNLPAWPTMCIVDKSGKVVYVQVGGGREKAMEKLVAKLLEAK